MKEGSSSILMELQMGILRPPRVEALTGLSRSTIRRMVNDGSFPPPVRLGARSIGWRESDVMNWLETRPTVELASSRCRD